MPPSEASAPGSIGKKRPVARMYSLSCLRVTPGWTTTSRSASLTVSTLFMRLKSSEMPPLGALIWPSSEVPVPKAMIGVLCRAQSWTICCTSSADSAKTTASGRWASWKEMSLPCCSRTACAVLTRSP